MVKIVKYKLPLRIISGISIVLHYGLMLLMSLYYKYPYVERWNCLLIFFFLGIIPAALPLAFTRLFGLIHRKLSSWKRVITLTASTVVIATISLFLSLLLMLMFLFSDTFGSRTENVSDYLVLDKMVERYYKGSEKYVGDIFPESIPSSASNIHYRYQIKRFDHYDLYLKITLSVSEFEAEKERIGQQYPEAEILETEDGVIEYRIDYYNFRAYSYEIIIFSREDLTVEYIDAYSKKGVSEGDIPYFQEISG